ncbi:hypothetical protein BN439_1318 [Erwinia amylovora Ea644]|nr:hypothetical protein BN439_1318 [Erwinia amylovora Ea644]
MNCSHIGNVQATGLRERLKIVGAMVPDDKRREAYFFAMRERAGISSIRYTMKYSPAVLKIASILP